MADQEEVASAIEEEIRRLAEVTDDDDELTRDVHVFDYGYIDSFSVVELIAFVESSFGIKVTDDDLASRPLNTINEMSEYVIEKIGQP
jgi:methoxymalonate biosynthesis acyl carrier protein